MVRAMLLLVVVLGASALATWYFGADVLIALGIVMAQIQVLTKKLVTVEWPAILVWLKTQTGLFFRVELLKKWLTTVALPMVFGRALARRIKDVISGYLAGMRESYARLMQWFAGLGRWEKAVAWAIVLCATLALSVTSLGLWLILFSVQLPFWLVAGAAALGKMVVTSTQKSLFKMAAFLQLSLVWRGVQKVLPRRWLTAKRRFDFRVARAVVRRRRLTVRQLADRKERLPFRTGVLIEYLFLPRRKG